MAIVRQPPSPETVSTESPLADDLHSELVVLAEKWLYRRNCSVVFRDPFKALADNGEQPDAIGWRGGISILIECKTSRSDFHADKRKNFRQNPHDGMGDWRFLLCPANLIAPDELPIGWGLLYATAKKRIMPVHGIPTNCQWHIARPFEGHKRCETQLLCSALRRLAIRGHFEEIYDTI